jgi:ADP-heptose:LPS heptosyltransferase
VSRCAATVLALRALGLGDTLTGVPALRGLRRAWPDGRLVLAAPAPVGQLMLELGVVDETLDAGELQPIPWPAPDPPDVAVNLHGSGPESHELLKSLLPKRLVAFANVEAGYGEGPDWAGAGSGGTEHEVDRWCRLVRSIGGSCGREDLRLDAPGPRGDVVVVHPGAAAPSRRWPVERWAAVVERLIDERHRVAVTGTGADADLCDVLATAGAENLCGRLSLADLARTVATAGLLLSGDTGVAHLATAYGTPSVVLFGPTSPATWGPAIDTDRHVVLWRGDDDEAPGDPHGGSIDPRLDRITVEEVLSAVGQV